MRSNWGPWLDQSPQSDFRKPCRLKLWAQDADMHASIKVSHNQPQYPRLRNIPSEDPQNPATCVLRSYTRTPICGMWPCSWTSHASHPKPHTRICCGSSDSSQYREQDYWSCAVTVAVVALYCYCYRCCYCYCCCSCSCCGSRWLADCYCCYCYYCYYYYYYYYYDDDDYYYSCCCCCCYYYY